MHQLKRQRAILSSVARELGELWWDLDEKTPEEELPVVAVDWSEIFAYATYTPPRESTTPQEFAAQYAGLCYLFFGLPCRLLLLPPYIIEMRNFLEMIQVGALLYSIQKPKGGVSSAYASLTRRIEKQSEKDPSFRALLEQKFSDVTDLTADALEILEELFKEHLPSIYLDLQQYTLESILAVRRLTRASDTAQPRLATLKDLSAELPEACGGGVAHWKHWMAWMESVRPGGEARNRADAVALSYLAALHSVLFWKFRRLLFATRSGAMFAVMARSPGEFPPSLNGLPGDGMFSVSSARSWEYFAEVGYYKLSNMNLEESLQDLQQREAGVEQLLLSSRPESEREELMRELGRHTEIWETLRGSIDLEGMGEESHWEKLKKKRDRLLVGLVRSLLSAESPELFFEERGKFAKKILSEIDTLLGQLPDELPQKIAAPQAGGGTGGRFSVWRVLEVLNPRRSVKAFLVRAHEPADALLADLHTDKQAARAAELLRWTSKRAEEGDLPRSMIDWLAGFSLYGLGRHEEARVYLANWLDVHASAAKPRFGLITRGIAADACLRRSEMWAGLELLRDVSADKERSFQLNDRVIWHTLLARFLIQFIERLGENSEFFPRGRDGNIGEKVIAAFSDLVAGRKKAIAQDLSAEHQALVLNSLLYLAARYLPENGRIKGDHHWFPPRREGLEQLTGELEEANTGFGIPEYAHTLGYFHWKLYLIDGDPQRLLRAKDLYVQGIDLCDPARDEHIRELIQEHLADVKQQLELIE